MTSMEYKVENLLEKLLMFRGFWNKNKTFKPKKKLKGQKLEHLHKLKKSTLGSGDLYQAVVLPKGEDVNEWLAVNTVDFFNMTNLIYGSVTEFCSKDNCPKMTAGIDYEYLWIDPPSIKKAISLSAPEYVDHLMTWIEKKVNNPKIFPSESNQPFPQTFLTEVKNIFKRLFRVYAHVYHTHFDRIEALGEIQHLNTAFKHFMHFVFEYDLIKPRELMPLKDTIIILMGEQFKSKFRKKKKKKKKGDKSKSDEEKKKRREKRRKRREKKAKQGFD